MLVRILLCYFLKLVSVSATSLIIVGGGFGEPNVRDSSYNLVVASSKISIGTFVEDFNPEQHSNNLKTLLENWREFASTNTFLTEWGPNCFVLAASEHDGEVNGYSFPGKKVYLFVTTSVNNSEHTLQNIREYGIYSSTNIRWVYPPAWIEGENDLEQNFILGTSHVDIVVSGRVDPELGLLLSSVETPWTQWKRQVFGEDADINYNTKVGNYGLEALKLFVLNSSPESNTLPYQIIRENNKFGITFQRRKESVCKFVSRVEATADFVEWNLPVDITVEQDIINPDIELVKAFVSPEHNKAFFRIKIDTSL